MIKAELVELQQPCSALLLLPHWCSTLLLLYSTTTATLLYCYSTLLLLYSAASLIYCDSTLLLLADNGHLVASPTDSKQLRSWNTPKIMVTQNTLMESHGFHSPCRPQLYGHKIKCSAVFLPTPPKKWLSTFDTLSDLSSAPEGVHCSIVKLGQAGQLGAH